MQLMRWQLLRRLLWRTRSLGVKADGRCALRERAAAVHGEARSPCRVWRWSCCSICECFAVSDQQNRCLGRCNDAAPQQQEQTAEQEGSGRHYEPERPLAHSLHEAGRRWCRMGPEPHFCATSTERIVRFALLFYSHTHSEMRER